MKKILIGTHNKGKFREIAYLLSKKYKKVSPVSLKIPSPKETSKSFSGNSKLKANFFSKFADFPVISDDSGLCALSLLRINQEFIQLDLLKNMAASQKQ